MTHNYKKKREIAIFRKCTLDFKINDNRNVKV